MTEIKKTDHISDIERLKTDLSNEKQALEQLLAQVDPTGIEKQMRSEVFKKMLTERYGLTSQAVDITLQDMKISLSKLPLARKDYKTKQDVRHIYDPMSALLAVFSSCANDLSVNPAYNEAYLIPYYNWKTKKTEIQFMPSYKGLLKLARKYSYKINCREIRYCEYRGIDVDEELNDKVLLDNNNHFAGITTIPDVDFTKDDINSQLETYQWKNSDLFGILAIIKNLETGEIEKSIFMNIAEVMERCMDDKDSGNDDDEDDDKADKKSTTKYQKARKIKSSIVKKALQKDSNGNSTYTGRRTDAIEMLKIRVLRYICKFAPRREIAEIGSMIDKFDKYEEENPSDNKVKQVITEETISSKFTELPPEDSIKPIIEQSQENPANQEASMNAYEVKVEADCQTIPEELKKIEQDVQPAQCSNQKEAQGSLNV